MKTRERHLSLAFNEAAAYFFTRYGSAYGERNAVRTYCYGLGSTISAHVKRREEGLTFESVWIGFADSNAKSWRLTQETYSKMISVL